MNEFSLYSIKSRISSYLLDNIFFYQFVNNFSVLLLLSGGRSYIFLD